MLAPKKVVFEVEAHRQQAIEECALNLNLFGRMKQCLITKMLIKCLLKFGPKRLPESVKEPIDYFLLFFKMQLVSFIVEQTNLYYQQQVSASQCLLKPFPDVCEEEILAFFGMIIAIGLYKLPKISDYWQTRGINVMPWFRSVFSKNWFFAINRYLHLNDNTKRPEQGHTGYKLCFMFNLSLTQSFRHFSPCIRLHKTLV